MHSIRTYIPKRFHVTNFATNCSPGPGCREIIKMTLRGKGAETVEPMALYCLLRPLDLKFLRFRARAFRVWGS